MSIKTPVKSNAALMLLALVVSMSGCSFAIGASRGSSQVLKTHEYVDVALMAVASTACVLAVVAWQSPDSYAPNEDFHTGEKSWGDPQDRADTIATGKIWTPIACTMAAAFLASGIYGHSVAPRDASGGGANWGPAAAAFANGFIQAGQPRSVGPVPYVAQPEVFVAPQAKSCASDFNCFSGQACVKAKFASTGYCAKAVDSYGLPTYQAPSLDSVGPKMKASCQIMADCPIGFYCADGGNCLKH